MECEHNGWVLAAWSPVASYWIRETEARRWQVAYRDKRGKIVVVETTPDEPAAIQSAARYCSP